MGLPPALHLYPHMRIHQVFGANTDVGKTIFATALALASAALPWGSTSERRITVSRDDGTLDASSFDGERVHYIKPISTGPMRDMDSLHIARYLSTVDAHTLFQFHDAVSPHVAVDLYRKATGKTLDTSDGAVLHALSSKIASFASASPRRPAAAYIETAGGVHSPAPSGTSFSALLRPLRLPTILIGDSNLGGISTTKSAYDSLSMAGYDIEALLLFSDAGRGWGNADYLAKWGTEIGLPVWALGGPRDAASSRWGVPPVRSASVSDAEDAVLMQRYYAGMVAGRGQVADSDESALGMAPVITHLRERHQNRIRSLTTMAQRTRDTCWWPFTQHMLAKSDADVNVIDSAHGDFFAVLDQSHNGEEASLIRPLLDGSASWWTQCLGHADARLTQAAARAAGRYGHVLFPMCANEPALELSETLLGKTQQETSSLEGVKRVAGTAPGQGWASRVFFSDDGSTGMEVALKMAIASASARYKPRARQDSTKARIQPGRQAGSMGGREPREWMVLGLKGSYHGDTIGAMDASEPNVYNDRVDWYRDRGTWFEPPTVSVQNGKTLVTLPLQDDDWKVVQVDARHSYESIHDVYDVEARMRSDKLYSTYTELIVKWLDRLTREQGNQYGALVIEPLIMGAGGMICVDPLFQRCLVDVVRAHPDMFHQSDPPLRRPASPTSATTGATWSGLPIIFDEVFTGLYRLGFPTPARALGVNPDVSVLAKILTGGMVPMSVTLASSSIFDTFAQSDQKADALLHGHSYTAHPIGCEVANETLRTIEGMRQAGEWDHAVQDWNRAATTTQGQSGVWSFWRYDAVQQLSCLNSVESAMALGTVLIVHLRDTAGGGGYSSSAAVDMLQHLRTTSSAGLDGQIAFNIHARPLGNVVYIMSSLNTPGEVLRKTEEALLGALKA